MKERSVVRNHGISLQYIICWLSLVISTSVSLVIQKPFKSPEAEPGARDNMAGSKRVAPAAAGVLTKLAGSEQVQQAVVEKGIEVAGKLVDKQLKIIDEAQEKASDFLKKEVSE